MGQKNLSICNNSVRPHVCVVILSPTNQLLLEPLKQYPEKQSSECSEMRVVLVEAS